VALPRRHRPHGKDPPGTQEVPPTRLSPVEASGAYLSYLKETWNLSMAAGDPEARFENQGIVITVPASFDEASQELTLEAARLAGYPERISLIEEPQAAFYDWLGKRENVSRLVDLLEAAPGRARVQYESAAAPPT
jgi:molecular chaperone DnaK (HSP70)